MCLCAKNLINIYHNDRNGNEHRHESKFKRNNVNIYNPSIDDIQYYRKESM